MNSKTLKATGLTSLWLLTVLLMCSILATAQSQSQYDRGTPPQHAVGVSSLGSYTSTELGTINLSNGSLNFKIPLGTLGGRGGLAIPMTLNYSSKVWSASTDTDIERVSNTQQTVAYADYDRGLIEGGNLYDIVGAGWTIAGWPSLDSKRVLIGKILGGPNVGCYSYTLTKLTLYLPDRGEIEFRDDATNGAPLPSVCTQPASRGTRWHATDGSGTVFINDVDNGVAQWPSSNLSGVVITADGTRIRFGSGGGISDRNGNKITGWTDQLGRTITGAQNVPDPDNPSLTLAYLFTIAGYQGQNRHYKIKKGIMNQNYRSGINPALPVITGDWDPEGWGYDWWGNPTRLFLKSYGLYAQRIDDLEVLTELILPDGRSLKFKYNQFGEVAEVELPTGGKIQYDYLYRSSLPTGNSPTWETGTNEAASGILTDVKWVDRAVTQKRTYPDGVTLEGTWTYGFSSASASVLVTSASGTLLSDTQHYFLPASRYTEYPYVPGHHDGTHYNLWSTGIEWRTETRNASGAVIAAREQDWTQRAPVGWTGYLQEQPANDNRVNQQRKFLDNGMMAKVDTLYDQFNNPTEVKEYDFDQSLKRRAVTIYSATNLVNGINYADDSIHLLGLPLQQSIYDGAGQEQARTIYEYDVYTGDGNHDYLLSYPSITGHDTANYGPGHTTRGNATRIGNWIKSSNSYLYAYPRYDIAGNVVSMKDARGYVTTVSFLDDFGNGSNPGGGSQGTYGATYAFPTLITSPPPNPGEPVQTARSQFDFSTGLLTGFRDRNNIVTQTIYNDPFNRPTLVKSALGISGVENHAALYYAPTTVFGVTLAKNDVLTTNDQSALDDATLRSWTVTDGFGRTKESWSRDPQGDVKGIAIYDALGRAIQTSNPFRPSLGESPVYTTTGYDFAGRTVSVTTPDNSVVSTNYSGNTVTVTDQTGKQRKSVTDALGRLKEIYEDPNGLNYLTSYSYDVLDNLTTVLQDSQTRSFVYDSLKRLTSAINPESGTISYQYDNNGNLTQKTDARGVVSIYAYDALNRNTTVDYSDTTTINPDISRFYDGATNGKGRSWYNYAGGNYSTGSNVEHTAIDSYDALGKPLVQRQLFKLDGTWGGQTYQTQRSYNLAGGVISQTYPSERTVSYAYDAAGRTNSFSGNLGDGTQRTYSTGIAYAGSGQMKQEQFGTTTPIYNKLFYNSRQQLSEIRESTTPNDTSWNRGAILNQYSLQCSGAGCNATDNNGNLRKQEVYIPNNEQNTSSTFWYQQYDYDSLNRLQRAHEYTGNTQLDWQQEYVYDRWGNRTIHQTNTWGTGINKKEFTVNTANNRLGVPGGQSGAMTYDAAGNLTDDTYTGQGQRIYDAENHMTQGYANGKWHKYAYNADGQRVRRRANGDYTWQIYGFDGELIAEYSRSGAPAAAQKEYGYRNGQLLITAEPVNLALGKPATQISDHHPTTTANKAVDGNTNGALWDGYASGTNSHTNSWWQVDLQSVQSIGAVEVWGRTDCCPEMTSNFYVFVSDNPFTSYDLNTTLNQAGVSNYYTSGYSGTPGTINVNRTGRYVRVQLAGSSYLVLGEVKVLRGAGGGGAQNVSWTNAVGVSVSGNNLTKTAANGWGNAGAASTQSIASGEGYVEFIANETNTLRMCGLSNGDTNQDYGDIDFAFYPWQDGVLYIFEGGNNRGTFGTYANGDTLRVAVESGVVKYRKNGTLIYTSTVAPSYPLLVDTALYSTGATINNVVISSGTGGSSGGADINWLVTDQLGTPRMIFDKTGSLATTKRHDYLPFGEELFAGQGARTTQQGYVADSVRQKFTQKERDNETGLDFFEARYYASVQGRFTSVDALLSSGIPGEPQSWNRYSYTINNPLKYIDPSGLIWVYQDSAGMRTFRWYDDPNDVPQGWTEYTGAYYDGADGRYHLNPNGPEGWLHKREDGLGFNYNWDPYVRNGWAKGPTPAQYDAYMKSGAVEDETWDIIGLLILRGPKGKAAEAGLTAKATAEAAEAIPVATNARLQRTIKALFQETDRIRGGTAGAIRHELETGELVGGKTHIIKGQQTINRIRKIMREEKLSPADRGTAQRLIHDLQSALKGK